MPRIVITKQDAEEVFHILKQYKDTLGFIPEDVLQAVKESILHGRRGAQLHFYKLLASDPKLLKQFHSPGD